MSKPLENYIIRIKSSIDQFDNEGVIREEDRDHIELMTRLPSSAILMVVVQPSKPMVCVSL